MLSLGSSPVIVEMFLISRSLRVLLASAAESLAKLSVKCLPAVSCSPFSRPEESR